MNKVILIGNLTRDVEIATTQSGLSVAKFSIAVSRKFKNADGKYDCDFFNCVAWRQLADLCHKYLKKGNKVGIVGSLQTRTYEQDGVKKYATDIIVEDIDFLTAKSDGGNAQNTKREKDKIENMKPMEDDDLPF
ncbi:MAG: single-stranded DNA-binding protein [Clostridia bacterium]